MEMNDQSQMIADDELFIRQAFKAGPEEGCELLFRRYHRALCSHAVRYVYSKEIAEDIVSDVFCKFWKNQAYRSVASLYRFYLFRSVRNEAYSYLRSEFQQLESVDHSTLTESSPVAIIDMYSLRMVGWSISNTMSMDRSAEAMVQRSSFGHYTHRK